MMSQGQIKEFPRESWTEVYRSAFVICQEIGSVTAFVAAHIIAMDQPGHSYFGTGINSSEASCLLSCLVQFAAHTTGSWLLLLFSRFFIWPNINHICNPISKRL